MKITIKSIKMSKFIRQGNCKGFWKKGQNGPKMAQNGVFGQKGRKGQKRQKVVKKG